MRALFTHLPPRCMDRATNLTINHCGRVVALVLRVRAPSTHLPHRYMDGATNLTLHHGSRVVALVLRDTIQHSGVLLQVNKPGCRHLAAAWPGQTAKTTKKEKGGAEGRRHLAAALAWPNRQNNDQREEGAKGSAKASATLTSKLVLVYEHSYHHWESQW